jgi:hypothetical protein
VGAYFNDGNGSSSGHVRIFEWDGSTWSQLGSDIDGEASGDRCGTSVSLSSEGALLATGGYYNDGNGTNSGHVRIFEWDGSTWSQLGSDIDVEAAGDQFGFSVSLSGNGSCLAIGAPFNDGNGTDSGHVRVFGTLELPDPLAPVLDIESFYESLAGQSVTVDATPTEGYPASFSYQWYLNDISISSGFGGTSSNYIIAGDISNEGNWKIEVTNAAGTASANFEYRIFTDTDSDGLSDYREINVSLTDPNDNDTDDDGLLDGSELNSHNTSPTKPDSDGDTILDGVEVRHATFGFDPLVDSSSLLEAFQQSAVKMPGVLTDSQLVTLKDGGASLTTSEDDGFTVNLVIEDSEDLVDWTEMDRVEHSLNASGTKKFIRIRVPE